MLPFLLSVLLASPQISSPRPPATISDACPLVIRVRHRGALITYRFNGWRATSLRTLESDLKGGCYNDANPSKVTSVAVEASQQAPASKLKLFYEVLSRNGWPRDRITIR